jgi:predicted ATPase
MRGLSQEDLADKAGLSRRGIADLERGVRLSPYPSTLRRLATALDLEPEQWRAFVAAARHENSADAATSDVPALKLPPLPVSLNALVGREAELTQLQWLLQHGRLVTLTGAGGSGKTRLALEIARASTDRFPDGVALVLLASVADPDLVLPTIAAALGVREVADLPLRDSVFAFLRPRRVLLLMDNFEHLLAAAPVLSDVLANCPRVSALCTSRQSLGLQGEQEFSVQPLQLPPVSQSAPMDALTSCASVVLFVQRAGEELSGFSLAVDNARTVADICLRLDGLPLAIELAAARLKVLSPQTLLERLERRLPLLIGGPRDLPARQRTLRDTISWSHDLLDAGVQRLFRRLAVFAGGCTLSAAEALCSTDTDLGAPVLDGLALLVDMNLLQRTDVPPGEPRFEMLETIREFALEQLESSAEIEVVRERHAHLYASFAEEAEPRLASGGRLPWLGRVAAEQENLRAALRWSVEQVRPDPGLRIVGSLWLWLWFVLLREGQSWAETLLRMSGAEAAGVTRSKALFAASVTAWGAGDGASVRRYGMDGIALAKQLGSPERLAYAMSVIASNMPDAGRNLHTHYAECIGAAGETQNHWLIAFTRLCYAVAAAQLGDLETACEQGRQAVDQSRAVEDDWLVALASGPLGLGLVLLGRIDEAEAHLHEALETFRTLGDWKWVINTLLGLALIARRRSDYETMAHCYVDGVGLCRDVGDTGNFPLTLEGLAATAAGLGDATTAAQFLGAAEVAHSAGGQPILPVYDELFRATEAAVRKSIAEAEFAAARKQGMLFSIDQSVSASWSVLRSVDVPQSARRGGPHYYGLDATASAGSAIKPT